MRQHAAIGDGAVEDRPGRRRGIGPEFGVDAIGCNHDVAFGHRAVGEQTRAPSSPLCSKPMPRWPVRTTPVGQCARQHLDEVGAMHAEGGVPARGVRHLHRRRSARRHGGNSANRGRPWRPIVPPEARAPPAAIAARCSASGTPCPDLAERRRLLVDRNIEAAGDQRVRGEEAANSASNDHDSKLRLRHRSQHIKCFGSLLVQAILLAANTKWRRRQFRLDGAERQREEFGMRGSTPALLFVRRKLAVTDAASGPLRTRPHAGAWPANTRTVP